MLTAYIDESGTHDGSLYVVIGGLIVDDEAGAALSSQWRATYRRAKVSHVHAAWVRARKKDFSGLTENQSDELLRAERETISRFGLFKFYSGVQVSAFRCCHWLGQPAFRTPYHFALHSVLEQIADWSKTLDGGRVDLAVASLSAKADAETRRVFQEHADFVLYRDYLGGLLFRTMRTTPLIQAADLVANQAYVDFREHFATTNADRVHITSSNQLGSIPVSARFWNRPALLSIIGTASTDIPSLNYHYARNMIEHVDDAYYRWNRTRNPLQWPIQLP